jgi:predicted HAD superfamily Cof-like phosphohydrolase
MPRSIDDLLAQADELADRFEDYEPGGDDRGEPTLMALRRTAYRRALIERELVEVVRAARQAGASWTKIGKELGTSGEAARQRYADRIDA